MDLSDLDSLIDEEGPPQADGDNPSTGGQAQSPPSGGGLTAEQLEQIMDRQNQRFQEQQRETLAMFARQPQQEHQTQQPIIEEPDPRDMRQALEDQDYERYIQLSQQQAAAREVAHRNELNAYASAAVARFDEMNQRYVQTSLPDYQRYKPEVEALMERFNLPASLRNNPEVVGVLVNAAKGQNIDREVEERIQARRRQRQQQTATGEPTPTRRNSGGAAPPEQVFTNEAFEALRMAGRSPDRHAQALGYENWAAYERATAERYANWDEINAPAWRRRMNSGRTTANTAG